MINNDKEGYDLVGNAAAASLQTPTVIKDNLCDDEDQF
jgi:hypothetical protein